MDEYEGDEEAAEDQFYEEEEDLFGSDIWGVLYRIPSSSSFLSSTDDETISQSHLVEVKRLYSEDFPNFFTCFARRSLNDKVVFMEQGVAQDWREDRHACTPTIPMFVLDAQKGILPYAKEPIELPSPCGLQDTYDCKMALSPAGDCLFVAYGDKGDINGFAFYQYDSDAQRWIKMWEDKEGNDCLDGYYTADGDFCIPENGNWVEKMPGQMTKGRILYLEPSEYWSPATDSEVEEGSSF